MLSLIVYSGELDVDENRNISNETRAGAILWDVRSPPIGPKYLNPSLLFPSLYEFY
jgi:hypothetical protein